MSGISLAWSETGATRVLEVNAKKFLFEKKRKCLMFEGEYQQRPPSRGRALVKPTTAGNAISHKVPKSGQKYASLNINSFHTYSSAIFYRSVVRIRLARTQTLKGLPYPCQHLVAQNSNSVTEPTNPCNNNKFIWIDHQRKISSRALVSERNHKRAVSIANNYGSAAMLKCFLLEMPGKPNKSGSKTDSKRRNNSTADRSSKLNTTKRLKDEVREKEVSPEGHENSSYISLSSHSEETMAQDRTCITPPSYIGNSSRPTTSSPNNDRSRAANFSIFVDDDEKELLAVTSKMGQECGGYEEDEEVRDIISLIDKSLGIEHEVNKTGMMTNSLEESAESSTSAECTDEELKASVNTQTRAQRPRSRFFPYSRHSYQSLRPVNTSFQTKSATMAQLRGEQVAPEHKVTLWLEGYPREESLISESNKDAIITYLNDAVTAMEEDCQAEGIPFTAPLFPSIQPRHGQLEIGCQNRPGSDFVLGVFGEGVDHVALGIGKRISATRTLEVGYTAPSFLLTVPGEITWAKVLEICSGRLGFQYTETWIKSKEVRLTRQNGTSATRFAIIMPRNVAFKNQLMALMEPETAYYPTAVRQAWIFKYQLTEQELGKNENKISFLVLNELYHLQPKGTLINACLSTMWLKITSSKQHAKELPTTGTDSEHYSDWPRQREQPQPKLGTKVATEDKGTRGSRKFNAIRTTYCTTSHCRRQRFLMISCKNKLGRQEHLKVRFGEHKYGNVHSRFPSFLARSSANSELKAKSGNHLIGGLQNYLEITHRIIVIDGCVNYLTSTIIKSRTKKYSRGETSKLMKERESNSVKCSEVNNEGAARPN